ncbi:hypothetical protein CPAST_c02080 [Clostridium pasteurianum DSM 525 = ATCC 6013]|uniref:Uncharacterized protein n=1 Tax=Clostridium pasteurianum DSM 525 = ATCC 6013 TaxID=1262449 RepID=A0A0H3J316_CLOPA|nr:hypothetical protein [Clostridium pasteurianum]AJA46308.1 hypothetical protein CPAST_c02080 [Clostridium pasteurianum DSM 525 = ATCC 6013]AJA50296.1 hypothetical protein CLPA_c02080 [Clostridium pasteurianum DSM 525 = ATCC 6013]KRU13691.1 hypothetical protein CP6013_02939 [Clostridium pasteurianum DSM 525 = ATCC 6013]
MEETKEFNELEELTDEELSDIDGGGIYDKINKFLSNSKHYFI